MIAVRDIEGDIAGVPAFWRQAEPAGESPILYVHGNPVNSDIWIPFLGRTGGFAPDLPGWGRSGKAATFDYTIDGLSGWLEAFLEHNSIDRFTLALHDWGGLALAMRPEVLERLDGLLSLGHVPLGVPGYRWHRIARRWRTPVIGELAMGFTGHWVLTQLLREGRDGQRMPKEFVQSISDHFDQGTQRAILRLYRSADEEVMERAADLSQITCPALLLWSRRDPYLMPAVTGPATAEALGGPVEFELLDVLGHWWWVDDPSLLDRPVDFLLEARVT